MSAEINTIDGILKPVERQECAVCGGSKRLVWVEHHGLIKAAIKCKCGTALYFENLPPGVINSGRQTAKPVDYRTVVLEVVRECEKESNEPVRQASIEVICAGLGIFPSQTVGILAELKLDSQIYDPGRNQRYKVV